MPNTLILAISASLLAISRFFLLFGRLAFDLETQLFPFEAILLCLTYPDGLFMRRKLTVSFNAVRSTVSKELHSCFDVSRLPQKLASGGVTNLSVGCHKKARIVPFCPLLLRSKGGGWARP
jgi:hypothetical protein